MIGGRLCCHTFRSGGGGPSLKMDAAIGKRRLLWMSAEFAAAHPSLAGIIHSCVRLPQSNWTLLASDEDFISESMTRLRGPKRQHRPMEVVGLLTKLQCNTQFAGLRNVFHASTFIKWATVVNFKDSTS